MKKNGFTLAEVLITLGIIGVVAALTLPSLIQNYQKQVWVNQLKKTVSILEQGFKMAMAEDGVDKLSETTLWASIPGNYCNLSTPCDNLFENMKKYFKMTLNPNNTRAVTALNSSELVSSYNMNIQLTNGADLNISYATKNASSYSYGPHSTVLPVVIDINGVQKPNKFGRDIYVLGITDRGQAVPFGGKAATRLYCDNLDYSISGGNYEGCINSLSNNNTWSSNNGNSCTTSGNGTYCAARIIENGWKMDY